jgi:hypothetical protein
MKEIDLGKTFGSPMETQKCQCDESVHYPCLHIEGTESLELPKSGTATIKFRVVSETEESRGGKEHYRCEIEVHSLSNVKAVSNGDNPKSYSKDTEDALDKLRGEREED